MALYEMGRHRRCCIVWTPGIANSLVAMVAFDHDVRRCLPYDSGWDLNVPNTNPPASMATSFV